MSFINPLINGMCSQNQEQLRTLFNDACNIEWRRGSLQRRIRFRRNEKKRVRLLKEIDQCNENLRRTWTQVDAATPNSQAVFTVHYSSVGNANVAPPMIHFFESKNRQTRIIKKAKDTVRFDLLFVSNDATSAAGDSSAWKQMQVVVVPKSTQSSAVLWSPLDPNTGPILPNVSGPPASGSSSAMMTSTPRGPASIFNLDSSEEIDYQNLKAINTICEVSNSPQIIHECFGFVVDESFPSRILNLGDLLKNISGPTLFVVPTSSTTLFKLERITLAVNLASSLLQLHATPWFNERWNKSEILFLSDRSNPSIRPVDIERPLLAHKFFSSEHWFAEPIESRRFSSDLVNGVPNSSTDVIVAERWVKENGNLENMPAGYYQAVSSCVFCFFSTYAYK
ncbi:uncharacterized protein EAF02_005315 [Botrytis sinoallii]|uniref:uncharacterized protein n=1 Tax=Botrytis sinoallii TaxID=1463999 RepID=UPI001900989D|nr:uncharacterized protein EAF02_005315 [Botrytis sinoallii]KAF7883395.1 hypothetical protein EAF02_005315 [Botrytis sinoallii]